MCFERFLKLRFSQTCSIAIMLVALIISGSMTTSAQTGGSSPEDFTAGTIIIPMDNAKQGSDGGSCGGPAFNLKAYGLVARLLNNNVPVKWAIADGKTKNASDFTATAVRYEAPGTASDSQNCLSAAAVDNSYEGGPFLIRPEYALQALSIINTFNAEIVDGTPYNVGTGVQNRVRIYIASDVEAAGGIEFSAPIRYTLTHKPKVAIGPDAVFGGPQGGYREKIHQRLFDYAKLAGNACTSVNSGGVSDTNWGTCTTAGYQPYYAPVSNETINATSCYTLATQAHASDAAAQYSSQYTLFAQNGGNLLFQCRSISVFENGATINSINYPGQFYQSTSPGWSLYGVVDVAAPLASNGYLYTNGAVPFSQFVSDLVLNQPGYVEEFGASSTAYRGRGDVNLQPVVSNTGAGSNPDWWSNVHVATVSDLTPGAGGNVFELGGHDYFMANTDNAPVPSSASLSRLNGQRMILNAVLTPAVRPGCGLDVPVISGFKQVQTGFTAGDDIAPVGFVNINDKVTWTIRYINTSPVPVSNFQIVDNLNSEAPFGAGTYVSHSLVVATGGSTTAVINPLYDGTSVTNLLTSGYLDVGGKIEIRVRTSLPALRTYLNHPTAFGTGLSAGGVKTDTVDATNNAQTVNGYNVSTCPVSPACFPQDAWQEANSLDPTGILLLTPTAAGVTAEGRVIGANGRGLSGILMELVDAATSQAVFVKTNSFGYFKFDDLEIGNLYVLTAHSKRYEFPEGSMTFTLNENITNMTFVGVDSRGAVPTKAEAPADKSSPAIASVPVRIVSTSKISKAKSRK